MYIFYLKESTFLLSEVFDVKQMLWCFKPVLFIKASKRNILFVRVQNFGRSLEMAQLKIDSSFHNFLAYLLLFLALVLKLLNTSYKHSLRHVGIEATSIHPAPASPFVLAFSPCVEKVKPPQQELGMYSC